MRKLSFLLLCTAMTLSSTVFSQLPIPPEALQGHRIVLSGCSFDEHTGTIIAHTNEHVGPLSIEPTTAWGTGTIDDAEYASACAIGNLDTIWGTMDVAGILQSVFLTFDPGITVTCVPDGMGGYGLQLCGLTPGRGFTIHQVGITNMCAIPATTPSFVQGALLRPFGGGWGTMQVTLAMNGEPLETNTSLAYPINGTPIDIGYQLSQQYPFNPLSLPDTVTYYYQFTGNIGPADCFLMTDAGTRNWTQCVDVTVEQSNADSCTDTMYVTMTRIENGGVNIYTVTDTFIVTDEVAPNLISGCGTVDTLYASVLPDPLPQPVWMDNCSDVTVTWSDTNTTINDCARQVTRTYTATDACGNSATCQNQYLLISSDEVDIVCPADTTLIDLCIDSVMMILDEGYPYGLPTISESCELPTLSLQTTSTSTGCGDGVIYRTWLHSDGTSACTQTITVDQTQVGYWEYEPLDITIADCDDIPASISPKFILSCGGIAPWLNDVVFVNPDESLCNFDMYYLTRTLVSQCIDSAQVDTTISWVHIRDTVPPILNGCPSGGILPHGSPFTVPPVMYDDTIGCADGDHLKLRVYVGDFPRYVGYTFTATSPFTLKYRVDDGCNTTECQAFYDVAPMIGVAFPNPSDGTFTVKTDGPSKILGIYHATGALTDSIITAISDNEYSVQVRDASDGERLIMRYVYNGTAISQQITIAR